MLENFDMSALALMKAKAMPIIEQQASTAQAIKAEIVRELSEVVRLRVRLSAGETEQLQASSASLGLNDKDNSLKQFSSWLVRSSILSRLK